MEEQKLKELKHSFAINSAKYQLIKKDVGKRLLFLRKQAGYKQQEVAEIIGISRAALSYYEKGDRSADIETLYKLCIFYEVSIDYLFGLKSSSSLERSISSINETNQLGFSTEALDKMWGNPDFVLLINDIANHKDFQKLEEITYHSRYTHYEEIDIGYRSFLTSQLLYSMMSDIFKQWYIDDSCKINELPEAEKQKLIQLIEDYFIQRKHSDELFESGDYPNAFNLETDLDSQLHVIYDKIKTYL